MESATGRWPGCAAATSGAQPQRIASTTKRNRAGNHANAVIVYVPGDEGNSTGYRVEGGGYSVRWWTAGSDGGRVWRSARMRGSLVSTDYVVGRWKAICRQNSEGRRLNLIRRGSISAPGVHSFDSRSEECISPIAQVAWIRDYRRADAGAGDRRDDSDFHAGGSGAAEVAAGEGSGTAMAHRQR